MPIVEYAEDGRITHVMTVYQPTVLDTMRSTGKNFLVCDEINISLSKHFVRDGMLTFMPAMDLSVSSFTITADGDPAVIEGLPDPCRLHMPDELGETETHEVTGGRLEFGASDAGRYTLVFEAFPFLEKTIEITVVAPLDGAGNEPEMWGDENADQCKQEP